MTKTAVATATPEPEMSAIARWAARANEAILERNRAITAAVDAGHSQRAVARAAGLTHPGVAKILARTSEADAPD